jgi:DNA-directed RNA polymerase specialized sigma24 family protein
MNEHDYLAERFEEHRTHLRAVAYRMPGSVNEADDAVQEAWLRLSRAESAEIDNLGGWLTTVVARVCLDMLRSRQSRREEPFTPDAPEPAANATRGSSPEQDPLLALRLERPLDQVGILRAIPFDEDALIRFERFHLYRRADAVHFLIPSHVFAHFQSFATPAEPETRRDGGVDERLNHD